MVYVKKTQGQSDDQLIKLFTRKATDSNVVQEYKDRRFHLNKQEKRKLQEQHERRMKRRQSQ